MEEQPCNEKHHRSLLRLHPRGSRYRQEAVATPAANLGALRDELIARGGAHAASLARGRAVRMALNQVLSDETAALAEGAEVAFFPPVTGG